MKRRDESAFTIVEVLIAALLLATVVSGLALAMASGSKLESTRNIKMRMSSGGERIYENLRSNKDWVKQCRRKDPTDPPVGGKQGCSITKQIDKDLLKDDMLGSKFVVTAKAEGIDNPGDGSKGADRDGVVDDFFRLTVTISVPKADRARLGNPKPQTFVSILNGSTSSKSGALVVAFCSADNQIDERVQISGCDTSGANDWVEMPSCAEDPAGGPYCTPWSLSVLNQKSSSSKPSHWLAVTPVNVTNYSLKKMDAPNKGMVVAATAGSVPVSTGVRRFADLPEGVWKVQTPSSYGGGRTDWATHDVPSSLQATVERQQTARALVMLQDAASAKPFTMDFSRIIHIRILQATSNDEIRAKKITKECEAPASFAANAFVVEQVKCNNASGHMQLLKSPGHMSANLGDANWGYYYESWGSFQDFVTIDYITESHDQDEWTGAADSATFATMPTPAGRYTNRTMSGGHANYTTPTWSVKVPEAPHRPSAGYLTTGKTAKLSGEPAGLNEPITMQNDSKINNVSTTWSPGGCEKRFVWVQANGSLSTCTGAQMVGDDGECYTHLHANSIGVGSYNWDDGCGPVQWPPLSGLIPQPNGYLITQICHGRRSWVEGAHEIWFSDWDFTSGLTDPNDPTSFPTEGSPEWDAQVAKYRDFMTSQGYVEKHSVLTVMGYSSTDHHWEKRKTFASPQMHKFNTGCKDMRAHPLDCPTLRRWDNCNKVYTLKIPDTPGWDPGGGGEDGQKFKESGNGIDTMSV